MIKPRMFLSDIIAIFLVYLGYLIIYFISFILMQNSVGEFYGYFQVLFKIMSWVLYGSLVLGGVGLIIFALRYAVWQTTTPKWERDGNGKRE